jgi:rhodanese-related sulfurtransferase
MNFPLPLETLLGKPLMYLVFAVIGFGFGYILEISGFGNSKRLAAQFYFKDLTVLKVMFTAIVVAMVLIFLAAGLGWLDFNQVWVNPTYLWPGIVGGLIMGVGFIIGGFCPGTSLVAMVTGKLDGLFFVIGGLVGIFLFGETVGFYEDWWNSSYYGRLTIMDWLNLPTGVVVVLVILMALFMFWGGEQLERIFGKRDLSKEPRLRLAGAGLLFAGALAVLFIGSPDTSEKWVRVAPEKEPLLTERQVQIHPGELLASMADNGLRLVMYDIRPESDYNLFHIRGSHRLPEAELLLLSRELIASYAPNRVVVLIGNDEEAATRTWKALVAEGVPNVYILEGGINHWLSIFAVEEAGIQPTPSRLKMDALAYTFPAAFGARYEAASPDPHQWELEYTPKIRLEVKRDKSGGGCG